MTVLYEAIVKAGKRSPATSRNKDGPGAYAKRQLEKAIAEQHEEMERARALREQNTEQEKPAAPEEETGGIGQDTAAVPIPDKDEPEPGIDEFVRVCKACGQKFITHIRAGRPEEFCSDACRDDVAKRTHQKARERWEIKNNRIPRKKKGEQHVDES